MTMDSRARIERLGGWCFRRRWWVVVLWPLLVVVAFGGSSVVAEDFRQSFALPGSETEQAVDLLADAGFELGAGHEGRAVVHAPEGVNDPAVRDAVEQFLGAVEDDVDGVTVATPYAQGLGMVSPDGTVAVAVLALGDVSFSEAQERAAMVLEIRDEIRWPEGVSLELAGDEFVAEPEFSSEAVGLVAAAVILLVAFGSLLAMGLPIVTALLGIGVGVAVVQAATVWIDIPPFAPATVAMLGIGVGIDYALFIVTRYREELASGVDPESAVGVAMATAGRSTVFAGATVAASLLGLLVVGLDDVRSLALAAGAGVLFVMLASITLLPALLGFVGGNIDRFGMPHRHRARIGGEVNGSGWFRWSRLLQRRPLPVAVAALLILTVLALPVGWLQLGLSDASSRPETDTTRRAHDLLAEAFGPGANAPLLLTVAGPSGLISNSPVLEELVGRVGEDRAVAEVEPPIAGPAGDVALVQVVPATGPQDAATFDLVERLRTETIPNVMAGTEVEVLVGGVGAAAVDFAAHNSRVLPWFIGVVLLLSFVLLVGLFRSVLVPLKAVLLNLLSVGAAYGVVVAVFQWGWLGGFFGVGEGGPVEAWVPMMLFAIVFGLSIDYEVFLLSRIRERYVATGDNSLAVADGLARTARLIAAAAAIMVCVFGAFALSADRALQMLGLGLAAAIAVDATLVRLVLVPATMELLGSRNWWLPGWIERCLPAFPAAEPAEPTPAPLTNRAG